MGEWIIEYRLANMVEGSVKLLAVNKFMAWELFQDFAKDFDSEVIAADCRRI